MVRQKVRKSIEELYGTKFDTSTAIIKPSNLKNGNVAKTTRANNVDYNYIFSSNVGIAAHPPVAQPPTARVTIAHGSTVHGGSTNGTTANGMTSRYQTARPVNLATSRRRPQSRPHTGKPEKFSPKEERSIKFDDSKKDGNIRAKTTRSEKTNTLENGVNMYDKNFLNMFADNNKMMDMNQCNGMHFGQFGNGHHQSNNNKDHRHHTPPPQEEEKDDETEEFFQLIRSTVEQAVCKSITELLNRNFRELSAKVDRFSSELKMTNSLLNKIQSEVTNKVVHYGEENSRHFRYLCMKSEYDKMFYQHHTMLVSSNSPKSDNSTTNLKKAPAPPLLQQSNHNKRNSPRKRFEKPIATTTTTTATTTPTATSNAGCGCHTNSKSSSAPTTQADLPQKSSTESVSHKSSELGMREVLEHIQRFCTQMQISETKCNDDTSKSAMEIAMKMKQQKFLDEEDDDDDDDDDSQLSSDGMTPRSDLQIPPKCSGAMTARNNTRVDNGAGDA